MSTLLYDAHLHLQDTRLHSCREKLFGNVFYPGGGWVVNGTSEHDWGAVQAIAAKERRVIPAFGIHPWYVDSRSSQWEERLDQLLATNPRATIGEVGLDRWVRDHHLPTQIEVLEQHLALAVKWNRPVTLHCIRAWGSLLELLRGQSLPQAGTILHAYSAPREMLKPFMALGVFFSFNATLADPAKQKHWQTFRDIPADRMLIETDAPDMPPPEAMRLVPSDEESEADFNHPGNLPAAYQFLADLRGCSVAGLAVQVEANFQKVFGTSA